MALEQVKIIDYIQVAKPVLYQFEEIKKATNDFSVRLGRGGSGSVFKGKLDDGSVVAVKRIDGGRYAKRYFQAEIKSVSGIHHANLVPLRGYCTHQVELGGAAFVVYDFFPKGSLDTWIFPKTGGLGDLVLSWKNRYQVALDVAKVLAYIHRDCKPQILHLDVKPSNILLNNDLQAVLCDFGLCKLTENIGAGVQSEMGRGTYGYKAPEMIKTNLLTVHCDMYSYGKVLLDLFFGQLYVCYDMNGVDIYDSVGNSPREQRTFHDFMWKTLERYDLKKFVDKRLPISEVNMAEANCMVHVALCCLKENPKERPSDMQMVLQKLENPKEYAGPEEKLWHTLAVKVHGVYNLGAKPERDDHTHLYACIEFEKEKLGTEQVHMTKDPKWEETFIFPMDQVVPKSKVKIWILGRLSYNNYNVVGYVKIDLTDVIEKKHVDQDYQLEYNQGKIHVEMQFWFGSSEGLLIGGMPHNWAKGRLVVTVHGVRYLEIGKGTDIYVKINLLEEKRKGLTISINQKWKEDFIFEVDETNINEKMKVYLYNVGENLTKSLIGWVDDIIIKRTVQRKNSKMWYQLQWETKSTPEISLEIRWIPHSLHTTL